MADTAPTQNEAAIGHHLRQQMCKCVRSCLLAPLIQDHHSVLHAELRSARALCMRHEPCDKDASRDNLGLQGLEHALPFRLHRDLWRSCLLRIGPDNELICPSVALQFSEPLPCSSQFIQLGLNSALLCTSAVHNSMPHLPSALRLGCCSC